ncbi:MAG: nitrous oxide-stimulated promoter family protein [Promethearchaeota archaeon]
MVQEVRRLIRERKTISIMIKSYCSSHHHTKEKLCDECQVLLDYAIIRIDSCPFSENKPTCEKCLIHCYKPEKREKIREVMRYAGPRMLLKHPILAIGHLIDSLKKPP